MNQPKRMFAAAMATYVFAGLSILGTIGFFSPTLCILLVFLWFLFFSLLVRSIRCMKCGECFPVGWSVLDDPRCRRCGSTEDYRYTPFSRLKELLRARR